MRCPDCGGALGELRMEGGHVVHRCHRCGGFFVDSWTVNRLTSAQVGKWRRISADNSWIGHGRGVCPLDGMKLARYTGESVPAHVPAQRCSRCGKWWFPRDSLFDYKPAQEAKINYFRHWGLTADLATLVLPILGLLILVGGLAIGVNMVRQESRTRTTATEPVRQFAAVYMGGGKMAISFEADEDTAFVDYRATGSETWTLAPVSGRSKLKTVFLEGLQEGVEYQIKVSGRIFEARAL